MQAVFPCRCKHADADWTLCNQVLAFINAYLLQNEASELAVWAVGSGKGCELRKAGSHALFSVTRCEQRAFAATIEASWRDAVPGQA